MEVDVYAGSLEGLVVAEVEFPSRDEAEAFVAPHWLGDELTGDSAGRRRTSPSTGCLPDPVAHVV